MEKLIYEYSWGDIGCSGTSYIAFEYESKDKFVYDILEKFKNIKWIVYNEGTSWESHNKVLVFEENDVYLDKYELDSIEHSIYTLDEWFEHEKIKIVI